MQKGELPTKLILGNPIAAAVLVRGYFSPVQSLLCNPRTFVYYRPHLVAPRATGLILFPYDHHPDRVIIVVAHGLLIYSPASCALLSGADHPRSSPYFVERSSRQMNTSVSNEDTHMSHAAHSCCRGNERPVCAGGREAVFSE